MSNRIMQLRCKIIHLIAEEIRCHESDISDGQRLDSLGIDRFDLVDMAMNIEDAFDLAMDYWRIEGWMTVGDLVAYVDGQAKRFESASMQFLDDRGDRMEFDDRLPHHDSMEVDAR